MICRLFGIDNKLDWVGFDACLMSSAELVSVFSEYADYLIASQETEPSFGWDYSFLSDYGHLESTELIQNLTDRYFAECEEYFERKKYDDRESTIACIDLSYADKMSECINNLFMRAGEDIDTEYNQLAASRVETRALGRASTGSDYDLIDIYDMSENLRDRYPDEVSALQSVLDDMIIINTTNADNLCGMSIYYPFYNKSYFRKTWKETYSELNAFPEYGAYLDKYTARWMQNDIVEYVAKSVMPNILTEDSYTLELTDEQKEVYTDSRYYILVREGEKLYRKIYSSDNITREGNVLTANFNGNIIYTKNKFNEYFIPPLVEHDSVGDITRYSCDVVLVNDEDANVEHRFQIAVNNATHEISTSALIPKNTHVSTDELSGGKVTDADVSQWSAYWFNNERYRYLQRYDNGAIMPLNSWETTGLHTAWEYFVEDDFEFTMAPLTGGEYYLIFEVDDSQGNSYCSEPLTIDVDGTLPDRYQPEVIDVEWDEGESVELFDSENVVASLTNIVDEFDRRKYSFEITNNNEYDIFFVASDLVLNGEIQCYDGNYVEVYVRAGETLIDEYGFDFGTAGLIDTGALNSIQFTCNVTNGTKSRTVIYEQPINVKMSDVTAFVPDGGDGYTTNHPKYDAFSGEHAVFEHNGLKGSVVGVGSNNSYPPRLNVILKIENTGDSEMYYRVDGLSVNGIYVDKFMNDTVAIDSGMTKYSVQSLYYLEEDYNIASIGSMELYITFLSRLSYEGGGGFGETMNYPITLDQRGEASVIDISGSTIYNDNGVRLVVTDTKLPEEDLFGWYTWSGFVTNSGDENLCIKITDITVNGEAINEDRFLPVVSMAFGECPVDCTAKWAIEYKGDLEVNEISFKLYATDFNNDNILWEDDQVITLNTRDY